MMLGVEESAGGSISEIYSTVFNLTLCASIEPVIILDRSYIQKEFIMEPVVSLSHPKTPTSDVLLFPNRSSFKA